MSEDFKKICLICGCHTSRTIDIYQPRNGPNIVELIKAKFKFQPTNEDKYLCYICNNWLINWNSLQNMNQESTRKSDAANLKINEPIPEEENIRSSRKKYIGRDYIRQRNKHRGFYFSRRLLFTKHKLRKIRKRFTHCILCGQTAQFSRNLSELYANSTSKCKTCENIPRQLKNFCRYINNEKTKKLQPIQAQISQKNSFQNFSKPNLVNRSYRRPMLDGKVVAMLRRLGTTLTRESDCFTQQITFCQIDSNKLPKSVKEGEVLIDFNSVITEVLPLDNKHFSTKIVNSDEVKPNPKTSSINFIDIIRTKIPEGVTISLMNSNH